jgi:DNA-binding CsgD family transcriptional regulator
VSDEAEFWGMFRSSRVAALLLDDDGVCVDANERAAEAMGRPRATIVGRHVVVADITGAAGLSPRESEITRLLAAGLSGEEIARRLVLSPETVRTHIRNAMAQVGARTRAHLIALAMRDGAL